MAELDYFRGWKLPPPVIEEFAGPGAVMENVVIADWTLRWTSDAVHLLKSGPWGDPWDGMR